MAVVDPTPENLAAWRKASSDLWNDDALDTLEAKMVVISALRTLVADARRVVHMHHAGSGLEQNLDAALTAVPERKRMREEVDKLFDEWGLE